LSQLYWADSCNYNNIYVFILPKVSSPTYIVPAQAKFIKKDLQYLSGTQEIIIADPIYLEMYFGRDTDINGNIILERESNNFRSDTSIIDEAHNILNTTMGFGSLVIGPNINLDILTSLLKSIQGVKNVFVETSDGNITNGISLVMINPDYKSDVRSVSQNTKLNVPFVPYFSTSYNLKSKIIVRDSEQILRRPVF